MVPRHSTPQPRSAHPTHLPQPLQLPPRTGETLDYEFPLARSRTPVPRARMGRDGRAWRWPGKVSSWIMSSPPRTKRSCQAGFGEPSAVMMTDSSRSSPAKPHPRAGTPCWAPGDFPKGWHRANPTGTRGQLELGWPRAQPSCCPHTSQGMGSLSNHDNSHQSSRFNWPLFSGREKILWQPYLHSCDH